jgi:hypothetical protein
VDPVPDPLLLRKSGGPQRRSRPNHNNTEINFVVGGKSTVTIIPFGEGGTVY